MRAMVQSRAGLMLALFSSSGAPLFSAHGADPECSLSMSFPDPALVPRTSPNQRATLITDKVPLTPDNVLAAYRRGVFPWEDLGHTAGWYVMEERAVLDFDRIHVPRSLAKRMRKNPFNLTLDKAFNQVIQNCAGVTRKDGGTWISRKFVETYSVLHQRGYGHSAEAWNGDQLVGGVYGILVDGVFSGESMFHKESDASKLALFYLIKHLRDRGHTWMDFQELSAFKELIGAREISRADYQKRLEKARANPCSF